MNKRLSRRFLVKDIINLRISEPIRYERYYINDNLRIQKKNEKCEKEILENNVVLKKEVIDSNEFNSLKESSYKKIIRDSYLFLDNDKISIKKYYDDYEGLIRVEVKFESEKEMNEYQKEQWMGNEITDSSLAFDKDLSKLNRVQFLNELKKFIY